MRYVVSLLFSLFTTTQSLMAYQDNEALHEFDALVLEKRQNFIHLRDKAASRMKESKFFSALIHLSDAELIFKNDAHLYFLKGYCYANILCYEDAISCYKKALKLNPNDVPTLMNLIELFYFQKEYEKVIVWYDKTLRVLDNKSSPLLNFKYYVSLIKLAEKSKELPGHKAKAFMDYTMMDDNPFYYYALAIKHHDAGNKEEFFAQIQSAAYIFNDLYLIKNWNKALQDASYLEASEIILRDLEKEE